MLASWELRRQLPPRRFARSGAHHGKEARPMQLTPHDTAKPPVGRPRKGHVYWHRDHCDSRIRLADGKRGKPQHLDPSVTEEQARKLAAQASVLALKQGTTPAPVPAPTPTSDEPADAWLVRWTADRRARGIVTADERAGRWKKW